MSASLQRISSSPDLHSSFNSHSQKSEAWKGKEIEHIAPASHKMSSASFIWIAVSVSLLVLGIILWIAGAAALNPALIGVGQAFFTLGILGGIISISAYFCSQNKGKLAAAGGLAALCICCNQEI